MTLASVPYVIHQMGIRMDIF